MKTAMQKLWDHLHDAEANGVYEIGTQNFKRYIEGIYFEAEKKQIIDAHNSGQNIVIIDSDFTDAESYYTSTFETNK